MARTTASTDRSRSAKKSEPGSSAGVKASATRRALGVVAILTLLFIAYALVPARKETTWEDLLIFAVLLAALTIVAVLEIRGILNETHPSLRALEAMVLIYALYLVTFSVVYLGMSHTNAHAFSEPLNHLRAFYLAVGVSTLGFGDIVANNDGSRLAITIQIFMNITLAVIVGKLVLGAVQRSRSSSTSS